VTWGSILFHSLLQPSEARLSDGRSAAEPMTMAWQLFLQAPWIATDAGGWMLWDATAASAPDGLSPVSRRFGVDPPRDRSSASVTIDQSAVDAWRSVDGQGSRSQLAEAGRTVGRPRTALQNYVLVMDALNFCFWAAPLSRAGASHCGPDPRWILGARRLGGSASPRSMPVGRCDAIPR